MWFEFRLTGSGWAEAGIGDDANHANPTASYLSDALGDLLRAVLRMIEGGEESRCSWEEEPGEFRWIFRRDGANVWLRLLEFDDLYGHRPDDAGRLVFETRQDVAALARAIALGASQVLERYGEKGYEDRWGRFPFPTSILTQIQAVVPRSDS